MYYCTRAHAHWRLIIGANLTEGGAEKVPQRACLTAEKTKMGWMSVLCALLVLTLAHGKSKDEWKTRIIYQVHYNNYIDHAFASFEATIDQAYSNILWSIKNLTI